MDSHRIITFTRWFKKEESGVSIFRYIHTHICIYIIFFKINNTSWLPSLVRIRWDRPHCNCEGLKHLVWSLMGLGLLWALTRSTLTPRKTNKHKNFAKCFPLEMGISTKRPGDFPLGSGCACKGYLWRQGSQGFQIVRCHFITDGKAISRKVLTMNFWKNQPQQPNRQSANKCFHERRGFKKCGIWLRQRKIHLDEFCK